MKNLILILSFLMLFSGASAQVGKVIESLTFTAKSGT
jgi:hypothetical protein